MIPFRIEIGHEDPTDTPPVSLIVEGEYQPAIPPNRRGHPDMWEAYGTPGVFEVQTVRDACGVVLPDLVQHALKEDGGFLRTVGRRLQVD